MLKKNNKISLENKRIIILFGFLIFIILFILLLIFGGKKSSEKIITEIHELMNDSTPHALYFMRKDCNYCNLNKSNMESLVNEYDFTYYEVDVDNLSNEDLYNILTELEVDVNNFGTPLLSVVANGKKVANLEELKSYKELFDFVKGNNLIDTNAELYLNYPSLSEYKKIIKSTEPQAIILATSYCQFCLAEHPVLIDVVKETGAKINYLFLDKLFNSQEEYDEFMSSLSWFNENNDCGTPTTLIVKNGKVSTYLSGYREKEEIIEFYKDNNIIK